MKYKKSEGKDYPGGVKVWEKCTKCGRSIKLPLGCWEDCNGEVTGFEGRRDFMHECPYCGLFELKWEKV